MKTHLAIASLLAVSLLVPSVSEACLRAVYFGKEGQTVTGRTMDWFVSDMDTNMWMYPRGLERASNTRTPFDWTSKYGSVVVTIDEGGVAADEPREARIRPAVGPIAQNTTIARPVISPRSRAAAASVISSKA